MINCETVEQADLLITNAMVLTMDADDTVIENGAVAIGGENIIAVGTPEASSKCRAENTVDASGKLIMPGLINAHTHMPMSLFRGLADDMPLEKWLHEKIFPAEAATIDPQTVRLGAQLSMAEMLLSGTTTCCDGYFLASEIADTVARTGMRAVLGQGIIDYPAPGVPDPKENIAEAERFVHHWKERSPLLSPSVFCHAAYTCSSETLLRAKETATKSGVLFQIHVAETQSEEETIRQTHGCSSVQYLDQLGLLDERTILVHAVWVDEADMDIVARSGAKMVHCPESNMKLATGVSPVPDMISKGLVVGLGTDGCASNNDLDLFGEMDIGAKLHKVHQMDPTVMSAKTMLRMATTSGAAVLGLDHAIGSLEVGKQADLIMIDLDQPHLTPMYSAESHLVYAVNGADVRDVMIAGRWVVQDRRLLTMDMNRILAEVGRMRATIEGHATL